MDDGIWRRAYNLSDRHFSVLVVALALAGYIYIYAIYATGLAETPIRSDGFEYYVYLPAVVIHHDPTLERFARDCCGGSFPGPTGVWRWPTTGRWVDRHSMGVAVLVLPFFVAGHLLTWWANLPPDGFSLFYVHASGIASAFYLGAVYVIASWEDWQFGGSYGHRAFTDIFPVLAISTAAGYEWVTRRWRCIDVMAAVVAVAVTVSVIQMIQYWLRIIPMRDTTWELYRSVFLKLAP
jgi:hypothetical protein